MKKKYHYYKKCGDFMIRFHTNDKNEVLKNTDKWFVNVFFDWNFKDYLKFYSN
jgi:hypothetical protein